LKMSDENEQGGTRSTDAHEQNSPHGTCYIRECGCPGSSGSFLQSWCSEESAQMQSNGCQETKGRCEGNCNGHWCPGGRRLEHDRNPVVV
jgi:hypothetical protein